MAPARLRIVYCSILNRDITLVSYRHDVNELAELGIVEILEEVKASIRSLPESSYEQKFTYPFEKVQVFVLIDQGITYLCITECTDSNYLPFSCLNRVREQFSEQPSLVSRSYRANEDEFDRDFCPVLVQIVDDFNSGRADKLSQVQEQIEDVKKIMLHNVERVIDRGERLDDLLSKAEELESQGQDFRRNTHQVYVQARCRNLKLWLLIGFMFAVFLTVVILFATGVIKS
ncbi:vesicle-associated membrane protein 721-like [Thrips palmi]|uniref:Vesicle-associated membrane protein 7 n=1 Tax=Thrips palmi TaxID=161013 RepID=A0A6P8Z8F3_THRPL|nr:vesicle-associated membrane protein 721-like [Thrips palmi]